MVDAAGVLRLRLVDPTPLGGTVARAAARVLPWSWLAHRYDLPADLVGAMLAGGDPSLVHRAQRTDLLTAGADVDRVRRLMVAAGRLDVPAGVAHELLAAWARLGCPPDATCESYAAVLLAGLGLREAAPASSRAPAGRSEDATALLADLAGLRLDPRLAWVPSGDRRLWFAATAPGPLGAMLGSGARRPEHRRAALGALLRTDPDPADLALAWPALSASPDTFGMSGAAAMAMAMAGAALAAAGLLGRAAAGLPPARLREMSVPLAPGLTPQAAALLADAEAPGAALAEVLWDPRAAGPDAARRVPVRVLALRAAELNDALVAQTVPEMHPGAACSAAGRAVRDLAALVACEEGAGLVDALGPGFLGTCGDLAGLVGRMVAVPA